jgi:hypothetical protein
MLQERRRTPRHRAYRPVRLHLRGEPQAIDTLTKDVSAEGLRCLSPRPVPVASLVAVELMLGSGQEPIVLHGQAIWFQTISESEQFDLGIRFLDPADQTRRRLSVFLDSLQPVPA